MTRVYFKTPAPAALSQLAQLAQGLQSMLCHRGVVGKTDWYYDEFAEDGTEYGVLVDVTTELNDCTSRALMHELECHCLRICGDVTVERE